MAYHVSRYKKHEFVPPLFQAELAVHQVDAFLHRQPTDAEVEWALEELIGMLRADEVPWLPDPSETTLESDEDTVELIVKRIIGDWQLLSGERPLPPRDDLVGILRTILASVETWSEPGEESRGYLRYLEGFMRDAGVRMEFNQA